MSLIEMGRTIFGFRKTWLEVGGGCPSSLPPSLDKSLKFCL